MNDNFFYNLGSFFPPSENEKGHFEPFLESDFAMRALFNRLEDSPMYELQHLGQGILKRSGLERFETPYEFIVSDQREKTCLVKTFRISENTFTELSGDSLEILKRGDRIQGGLGYKSENVSSFREQYVLASMFVTWANGIHNLLKKDSLF